MAAPKVIGTGQEVFPGNRIVQLATVAITGDYNDLINRPAVEPEIYPAGAPIADFSPVVMLDGMLYPADANTPAHAGNIFSMAINSAAMIGDPVAVQRIGELTNFGWAFTPGDTIFVGLSGALTNNPTGTAFIQAVGTAETATKLVLNIKPAIRR